MMKCVNSCFYSISLHDDTDSFFWPLFSIVVSSMSVPQSKQHRIVGLVLETLWKQKLRALSVLFRYLALLLKK